MLRAHADLRHTLAFLALASVAMSQGCSVEKTGSRGHSSEAIQSETPDDDAGLNIRNGTLTSTGPEVIRIGSEN